MYLRDKMTEFLPPSLNFDIRGLIQAIQHSQAGDALKCHFSPLDWEIFARHMQPLSINAGQVIIERGAMDRTIYFVENGMLSVHYEDESSRIRMAMVGAGTVLGEGAFFSHQPRSATVHASSACKLWCLTAQRFSELAMRHSPIALELSLAIGAVMAKRHYNQARRVSVA